MSHSLNISLVESGYTQVSQRNSIATTVKDSNDSTTQQIFTNVATLIGDETDEHLDAMQGLQAKCIHGVFDQRIDGCRRTLPFDAGSAHPGTRWDSDATRFLKGGLDSLAIDDRALSDVQVSDSWAGATPHATVTVQTLPNTAPVLDMPDRRRSTQSPKTR